MTLLNAKVVNADMKAATVIATMIIFLRICGERMRINQMIRAVTKIEPAAMQPNHTPRVCAMTVTAPEISNPAIQSDVRKIRALPGLMNLRLNAISPRNARA